MKIYPNRFPVAFAATMLAVLFALTSCATYDQLAQTRRAIKQSKFELRSVDARVNVDLPQLQDNKLIPGKVDIGFKLGFWIENRFGRDLPMNRIDVKLYADDEMIATGTTKRRIVLAHAHPTSLTTFVDVDPAAATSNLVKRLQGKRLHYRVDAVFYFNVGQFEIPIRMTLAKKTG